MIETNEAPFGCNCNLFPQIRCESFSQGKLPPSGLFDLPSDRAKPYRMTADAQLAAKLAADPMWIPHRIDLASRRVQFINLPASAFGAAGFLADHKPADPSGEAWLGFDTVRAMKPETAPVHFIFHTAFCRSTLLVRALHVPGASAGLNEPAILASLASGGEAVADLVKPCLDLLSRPHSHGESVFIKPTNMANRILPAAMAARPDAKAILMSHPLDNFLGAIYRRGLMGRRWARELFLDIQQYAPADLGMDGRETFVLTDMLTAGLAWFLQQRWFAMNMQSPAGQRMRVLDGNSFNDARARTLSEIASFTGIAISPVQAEEISESALFQSHAKLGGNFAVKEAQDNARSRSAVGEEEAKMVGQWLGQIIAQTGDQIPLKQTLF